MVESFLLLANCFPDWGYPRRPRDYCVPFPAFDVTASCPAYHNIPYAAISSRPKPSVIGIAVPTNLDVTLQAWVVVLLLRAGFY